MGKIKHEKEVDLTLSHHAGEWWKVREVEIQLGFQHLLRVYALNFGDMKTNKNMIWNFSKLSLSPFYTKGRPGASLVVSDAASWLCPYLLKQNLLLILLQSEAWYSE